MRCWRRRAWVLQLRKRGERGPRERTAPAFSSLDSSLPATLTKKPNPKTGTDHVFFLPTVSVLSARGYPRALRTETVGRKKTWSVPAFGFGFLVRVAGGGG